MTEMAADSKLFEEVVRPLLEQGLSVRFQARGASMSPAIRDGEIVEVTPVIVTKLRKDDIVLAKSHCGFRLHRIVLADPEKDLFVTRGDCGQENDPVLRADQILGLARAKEVRVGRNILQARFRGVGGWLLRSAARLQSVADKSAAPGVLADGIRRRARTWLAILGILLFLAVVAGAQVAVDTTTFNSGRLNGAGATLTVAHTTAGANRLLVVGVSINISSGPGAGVVGVTYNAAPLSFVGAHNDAGGTRRVEMWYLLAPPTGGHNVVVTVNTAGAQEGVVAGATTFTGVDQTVPLGTFVSADGAAATCTGTATGCSALDVPSVVNGMVIDTLATGGTQTVAVGNSQTGQWNQNTGNNASDVRGTGSTRPGAPSVPISETFSGTSNWSLGAVSINPSNADIGVTTSVSAVALGQNSTYNITVKNNGPSPANNVVLTDTLAPGLTLISTTPSAGSCSGTGPITCTLPTPLTSGASVTIAVVVNAAAAGFYPNTATITDSGTPPDSNTGNNTYVAVAPVVNVVCASGVPPNGGTLTGVVNTYFPGTANVSAGATSIPIGTANGSGTIVAGSELLVIQMQDASINSSNTVAYGNGSTGTGFTTINNAGNYEFVTATGPVSGGSVPILGAGTNGGLVFGYTSAAASATKGQSTFQVVLVPQYNSATLSSSVTAAAWDGSTGGILALDIASTLNLGGSTISLDGLGFRGGAGMQLQGGGGANTDFVQAAPATYTGIAEAGWDAPKGEGVAGTPAWVESASTFLATGTNYPSGTAGVDGSMAQGAPANAGGGATDGHPNGANPGGNDQNAGGGGGGNGGTGGEGGDSWNTNVSSGGNGGAVFPSTIDRIAMGGGGGAGTRNNSPGDALASSGAAGGGIVFIRAFSFSGTATISANGAAAYNGTSNDAGGGGGAGGTIVMLASNGGEGGLTLRANGGRGGDAWDSQPYSLADRHGPGGGGGGGVIFVSAAPASASVTGGVNGTTLTPGVAYGATSGSGGSSSTSATLSQVTGLQSTAVCTRLPDLTITKSHVGTSFTRGSAAAYTLSVTNVSTLGATSGLVTVNDTLPFGITPTGASGTGWTCTITGQTVSCTRSDVLAVAGTYPSITVNTTVTPQAPATLINTGTVGGGGDVTPLNDSSTDTVAVVSTADMSVTDSGSPNPVATNGSITYTVVVTDNGPSAADNATLVLSVPNSTTFSSLVAPAGWSCQSPSPGGTGSVVCTNANLATGSPATFTFIAKVATGTTNGTVITATATVSSSVLDTIPANNTATVTTIVGGSGPNLSVTNIASPNPVQAGSSITYTQVVTNTGSSAITNGTFTEATPANTTFVSITPPAGWSCVGFPASPCTAASVGAGASGTFSVVYTVNGATPAGTVISDTVTVNATNQSFGANSATATDVVASATQADVALSTVATPSTVYAGNSITYTQRVTNNGPAAATGVSFTEATPTNTTFQSASAPAGWSCTTPAVGGTGTITCTDTANLSSGNTADIVVVLNVPSSVAIGTITATSSVSATTSDPTSSNNSTSVTTSVNVACDLAVTNAGTPSPVAAGNTITYTQVVTNLGPSNCSGAAFTEATPNNSSWVSDVVVNAGGATWSCPSAAPISCTTSSSIPPGSTGTITAVYRVTAGTAGGTLINDTATVASTTRDLNAANNSATVTIPVSSGSQADLSVTNSASPNPVTAGNNITYTQTVTNSGQATANAPVLSETLPAGTTPVSLTGPAGWTCVLGTLKCTASATMPANTTASFTFVVTVGATVASGTTITQTDSVASTTTDPNGANNSAAVNTIVAGTADLSITNTANPVPVLANATITYTQVVTNSGPSTATSVNVVETLPANTTAQTLTGTAGWTCVLGTLTCSNPSFAAGTGTITYTVLVNNATPAGTAINETATVSTSITDSNPANNSATASDVVATATQSDLVVTNSAAPTSVSPFGLVTYTQTVTNKGPAVASGATFTQVTPPNTTFQSITPPAGWTCGTKPAVGGTGTITCTASGTLAVNSSGTFTLVLQVNSNTPSGTNITETATATATNIVPSLTSNTASTTVVVADANSADVAIVKTATPNPVTQGTPATYTLTVTNNGPASATNVTVTDTLPSSEIFLSATSTSGSCSEAGGTVACLLGTMANAGTATITILAVPGQPGVISNTATVDADQNDANLANNSSTQNEVVVAPTKINLQSFSAHFGIDSNGANRVVLNWKTGGEAHNLGFNVYREQGGNRVRVNPSIIAGSALLMSGALPRHSAKSYAWIDPSVPGSGASYWLEDIDVNGTRTMHGPIMAEGTTAIFEATAAQTRMLSQISQAQPPLPGIHDSHYTEAVASASSVAQWQLEKQFEIASHPAVKIEVRHEGWYRVGQPELVKAGLDPNVDAATLHLYAEALELPIQVSGATPGPGGFGPQAAINFYGTAFDTVFSGTRVYWLTAGEHRGARIRRIPASTGSNAPPASYPATVELKQHTVYFSALITTDGQNFFGSIVSSSPLDQALSVPHLDTTSSQVPRLEVSLRGIIVGVPHDVSVALNGTNLGDVTFTGQAKGTLAIDIPAGILRPWNNTVTLTARNGDYDTSLVDYIRVSYPHKYVADSDRLKFTASPGEEIAVDNFSSAPVVLDITDPNHPVHLTPRVTVQDGKYQIAVQVPFTTTNPQASLHTLLAVAQDRISSAPLVMANRPSHWHAAQPGSDIAMVTYGGFATTLLPLIRAHQAEGKTSAVVPVVELYDEFNFGEHSPVAIKRFLQSAKKNWKKPPAYLLLNGRASFDPRNYLGFGNLDLVPTAIVPTSTMMTSSDDWFSDFKDNGMPTIATGRLPVSNREEAITVIGKISSYESQSTDGPWNSNALFVADKDDVESFTQDSQSVQTGLPATVTITNVFVDNVGTAAARTNVVNAINSGQGLVNYLGHGSEDQWAGSNIFDQNTAGSLNNGRQLPVFLIMDCLNGFFHDVYAEPLAVTLMLSPNGGASAVVASSGLNQPAPQTILDAMIVQSIFTSKGATVGEALVTAKSGISDTDVRRTFILFGDPAMKIKSPAAADPTH